MLVVHSFGRHAASPNVHVVGIDNVACGRMAVQALIGRGYTKIAFLGGPENATSTQDRLTGFLSEMAKQAGVEASFSFASAYSFEAGRSEMTRLLQAAPPGGCLLLR